MEWLYRGFWFGGWLLLLLGAVVVLRALFGDLARGRRRCPRCWYDMSASGLRCPECGKEARSVRALYRTRRRWRRAGLGILAAAVALVAWRVPLAITKGWWAAVPGPALVVILQFWDDDAQTVFQRLQARMAAGTSPLSRWEELLLARHCGVILDRPEATLPAARTTGIVNLILPQASPKRAAGAAAPVGVLAFGGPTTTHAEAFEILAQLGPSARPAVPALIRQLDRSPQRLEALRVLQGIGPGASRAINPVLKLTGDPEFEYYRLAFETLSALSASTDNAFDIAHRVIENHPDLHVKIHAAQFLISNFSAPRTMGVLVEALKSPSLHTRVAAARGLERMGPKAAGAIPALVEATRDPALPLEAMGISVLATFGERAAPALAQLAADPAADIARPAVAALGGLGPAGAPWAPVLIRALSHPDGTVACNAAASLGRIGAAEAIPLLKELAASTRPGAEEAERALEVIRIAIQAPTGRS